MSREISRTAVPTLRVRRFAVGRAQPLESALFTCTASQRNAVRRRWSS
jgi:hypothetical protein